MVAIAASFSISLTAIGQAFEEGLQQDSVNLLGAPDLVQNSSNHPHLGRPFFFGERTFPPLLLTIL